MSKERNDKPQAKPAPAAPAPAGDAKPSRAELDLKAEADAILAAAGPDATPGAAPGVPAAPGVQTGEMVADLLDITFNGLIAPRRGDHWKLSADESKALGHAYGAVFDKYLPNLQSGPEFAAVIVTVAVIGPKIAQDRAIAAKASQDTKPGQGGAVPHAAQDQPVASGFETSPGGGFTTATGQ